MCSMSVLCPLCAQTSFSSIDALRCSLIKAANGPLACPICHELFLGLDKLTIHLFSHTNIMNSANDSNNNKNHNTPASTPNDTQNIKNTETFKTKDVENLNRTQTNNNSNMISNNNNNNNNNNSTCNDTNIIQTHLNEVNFGNTHHHPNMKSVIKKAKVVAKADKKIINKTNTSPITTTPAPPPPPQQSPTAQQQQQQQQEQHQQLNVATIRDQEETNENANLATCDICEFTFRNEELKNMHVRLVHRNFECHSTSSANSNPSPNTSPLNGCHNSSPQEHEFKCHLCSKTFKMKGSLRVHLKVVHLMGLPYVNNTPKLTICDRIRHKENKLMKSSNTNQTEAINTLPSTLNYKIRANNNGLFNIQPVNFISSLSSLPNAASVSVVNLNQPVEFQQTPIDNAALQTSNVLLVFNTGSSEMAHNLNSIPNNMATANSMPSDTMATPSTTDIDLSTKLTTTMCNATENPKIWECDVCSKAFTTKYFLKKHKRLHTGEMPYTCELCARTFTFQQSYHKHLLYHSDEKPHVCSTCGRAFKELSTLHNHERIHSGEKPFKCEVCGKSFRQRVSFLVHTRIHTGVMPYKCETCQRSFRYKVSQRTHKCQANSPEESTTTHDETTIDQMSEHFIKAFLETSVTNQSDTHLNQAHNSPASNEIATINEKATALNEQQALLTKTIDDIVVESCNKLGIGNNNGIAAELAVNEGSMSPSQKLQNMSLYSPQLTTSDLNGIEGDLTRFFLENSHNGNNLL